MTSKSNPKNRKQIQENLEGMHEFNKSMIDKLDNLFNIRI